MQLLTYHFKDFVIKSHLLFTLDKNVFIYSNINKESKSENIN